MCPSSVQDVSVSITEADDIQSSLYVTNMTDLPLGHVTPWAGGRPNVLTLTATNGVS